MSENTFQSGDIVRVTEFAVKKYGDGEIYDLYDDDGDYANFRAGDNFEVVNSDNYEFDIRRITSGTIYRGCSPSHFEKL